MCDLLSRSCVSFVHLDDWGDSSCVYFHGDWLTGSIRWIYWADDNHHTIMVIPLWVHGPHPSQRTLSLEWAVTFQMPFPSSLPLFLLLLHLFDLLIWFETRSHDIFLTALALNSQSSHFSLLSARIIDTCYSTHSSDNLFKWSFCINECDLDLYIY